MIWSALDILNFYRGLVQPGSTICCTLERWQALVVKAVAIHCPECHNDQDLPHSDRHFLYPAKTAKVNVDTADARTTGEDLFFTGGK
jgi:hypothetical protein